MSEQIVGCCYANISSRRTNRMEAPNMRFMRRTYLSHKKKTPIWLPVLRHLYSCGLTLCTATITRFWFSLECSFNCALSTCVIRLGVVKHAHFYGYFKSPVVPCTIKQVHCPCACWWRWWAWLWSLPFHTVGSMSRRLSVSKACSRSLTPWGFG